MRIYIRTGKRWAQQSHGKSAYILVYLPEHPFARSDGSVLEHRVVMELMIGRYLKPAERVHHRDGDGFNNLPENLELFSNAATHNSHMHTGYQGWFPKGHVPTNKTFTTKTCVSCLKEFELPPRKSERRRTCSTKCRREYGWQKR